MSVELIGVSHSYRGQRVLSDINLILEEGESTAIVGPSGSGKTTLLSIIGHILRPTDGKLRIEGTAPVRDPLQSRGRLFSWVFQTANVLGHRTVADNVALGALSAGTRLTKMRGGVEYALSEVGVAALAHTPAFRLSGGELQRVQVARAIVTRSRFILADEPTGQLDTTNTLRVAELLLATTSRGSGVIIATHDRDVASKCDRVLELVNGALIRI